jgi:uncharacterized membrane protein HdeD (DUF308 family)
MIETFLLGVIASSSAIAGLFFLRFWRDTRDPFFLSFAASFLIEALNRVALLFVPRPNEGSPWIYLIRLFASLLILTAIIRKNYGRGR